MKTCITLLIILLMCGFSYTQESPSDKEKITDLEKELEIKNKKIEDLESELDKLNGKIKTKGTILERLASLEIQLEKIQKEKGIINITYLEGEFIYSKENGPVTHRKLSFSKKEEDSLLRITYQDTFRLMDNCHGTWSIEINSQEKLKFQMYGDKDDQHRIGTFIGYVLDVPKGNNHLLEVFLKTLRGNAHTGLGNNKFMLQVEEIAATKITRK